MKLLLHIFAFVLLSGVAAFAQGDSRFTISGRVLYQPTKEILPFSTIRLIGTTRGVFADSLGKFKITGLKSDSYTLNVSTWESDNFDTTFTIQNKNIDSFDIIVPLPKCERFNSKKAKYDIATDSLKLLIVTGLGPKPNSKKDEKFKKKYNIMYYDFECSPDYIYCIESYNRFIFQYLDEKYGKKWRKSIWRNVIGFKEYIKEN